VIERPRSSTARVCSTDRTSFLRAPQFKLSHELKDLYYALELGRDLEDPLPITAVVSQIYNAGMSEHAEDDLSAVAEVYRQREK
jgi:3-hydroxyisobutyrate dehydrogenase-like beta-hydroxyacid dehydrogenase